MKFKKQSKFVTVIVLLYILFFTIIPVFLIVKPAQAFSPGVVAVNTGKWIWDKFIKVLDFAYKHGGAIAYRNTINQFLGQAAQQSAEYLASGGKGQKPMFITDKTYFTKLGDNALGEFIDTMAKSTGITSQSLCEPIDPTVKLHMLLSLDPKYKEINWKSQNRCSLSKIAQNIVEASHKKLFDFSVELKEGSLSKQEQLKPQISSDSLINGTASQSHLINICINLEGAQDNLKTVHNEIISLAGQKWKAPDEITREKRIIDSLNEINDDIRTSDFHIKEFKDAQNCVKLNKDEFCGKTECISFYSSPSNCSNGWNEPIQATGNIIRYYQAVIDWRDSLRDVIQSDINIVEQAHQSASPTLADISRGFNPEASDIGVMLSLQSSALEKQTTAINQSKFFQSLQGDMSAVTSKISGLVMTPASIVKEKTTKALKDAPETMQYTGDAIADATGIFMSTFLKKTMENITKGLNPNLRPSAERTQPFLTENGEVINSGEEGAKTTFADLATVQLIEGGKVNLVREQFAVCPEDKKYALPTNCVIDTGLQRAIEEKMTIREAMEKNLLHPDWTVGGYNTNDSANDYMHRYSLTNIQKLRRARIVPLGLQIAAKKISQGDLGDIAYTLEDIVDGFNEEGGNFYHLVDPNWVLKTPSFKCESQAYAAIPVAGSNQRQETCVNLKDCISENEDGSCNGWGYCTREKNIWRMGGDSCDEQYSSCQNYQRANDKKQFSYIKNTLDFNNCNQNNVGCQWYCKKWDNNLYNNGAWACQNPEAIITKTDPSITTKEEVGHAIFFDSKVQKCDASSEGCHEYIRTKENLGTNLAPNSSFEDYAGVPDDNGNLANDAVTGWDSNGTFIVNEDYAHSGEVYAELKNNGDYISANADTSDLYLLKNKKYTFSIWVKNVSDVDATIGLYKGVDEIADSEKTITKSSSWSWQKVFYTYTIPENNLPIKDFKWKLDNNSDIYIDDIQIERGDYASSYKAYGSNNQIYFKANPDRYNCPAITSVDENGIHPPRDPECTNYAQKCLQEEVGCELYTPLNQDPKIPAVIADGDKCPSSCVGYDTFREVATNFDDAEDVNLIPSTAKVCSSPGCVEFTNLDKVAQGGEGLEYYSYIRPCRKPDTTCSYYYTWVGSDTQGYQLKRYYLQSGTNGPKDANIVSDPEAMWGECDADHILTNPNCKEFYDTDGNISYHLYPNTITCSEDCHPLRKTKRVDSNRCPTGLGIPGVSYDAGTGICTYMAIPNESTACSQSNAECREYRGPEAGNFQKVFFDDFEDGQIWTGGTLSSESVSFPGHSMYANIATIDNITVSRSVSGLISQGKSYFLSFWIKGTTTISAKFSSVGTVVSKDGLNKEEWQEVKLGPIYFDKVPASDEKLEVYSGSSFYIDNVTLKATKQDVYLIKDSWQTPCECDTLASGNLPGYCTEETEADSSMIGCSAYQDRSGNNYYLKSFDKICRSDVVGCEALIDTHNSSSPFKEEFNESGEPDYVDVQADDIVYLVNDKSKTCSSDKKGCQLFGQPKLDTQGKAISYTNTYLINDPDIYNNKSIILCQADDLGCQKYFPSGSQTPVYFKDPGDNLCEWRKNVMIGSGTKTGWFKKGTDQPCYYNDDGTAYEPDGVNYGIRNNNDSDYQGRVGLCPAKQSGCTDFSDASSHYYYLNNDKLDKTSCQGRISQKEGCVLFLDPSQKDIDGNVIKLYSSIATYNKSKDHQYGLVDPVDCSRTVSCLDSKESGNSETDYCKYCYHSENNIETNDTNMILKVQRDRVCGQWLTCMGYQSVWDKASGSYRDVCESYGQCDKLVGGKCSHYIIDTNPVVLDEDEYTERDVSWDGMDYSGLSINDIYPVDSLKVKEYENGVYRLTYIDSSKQDKGIDGQDEEGRRIDKICRAYPEKESPFKKGMDGYYKDVNICQDSGDNIYPDCQCNYWKADYSSEKRYYSYDDEQEDIPEQICIGGVNNGKAIPLETTSSECTDNGGIVQGRKKLTQVIGLRGFCLEPDKSKPDDANACITWWPGGATGDPNIYQQFESAGYIPEHDYYCVGTFSDSTGIDIGSFPDRDSDTANEHYGQDENYCQDNATWGTCDENNDANDYNEYGNAFCIYKSGDDSISHIFTYFLNEDGCVGNQDGIYCHSILKDITLGMVKKIEVTWGGDAGGHNTECGDVDSDDWPEQTEELTQGNTGAGCLDKSCFGAERSCTGGYIKTRVYFASTDTDSKLNKVEFGIQDCNLDDETTFTVKSIKIYLKDGCQKVVKIANGTDVKAYTNRVNNVKKDYAIGFVDDKTRASACKPWGAINSWDEATKPYVYEEDGCHDNKIDPESIYSSQTPIKDNLFARSYGIWNFSYDGYCLGTCENSGDSCVNFSDCGHGTCSNKKTCEGCSEGEECSFDLQCLCDCQNITCSNPDGNCTDKNAGDQCYTGDYTYSQSSSGWGWPTITDGNFPHIASVQCNGLNCDILHDNAITIGGIDGKGSVGSVKEVGGKGVYSAVLRFYAWADKDQMPISKIEVNWKDGNATDSGPMMAKNHKPKCCESNDTCSNLNGIYNKKDNFYDNLYDSDDVDGICNYVKAYGRNECLNFGNIPDACVDQYYQLVHIYTCNGEDSPGWNGTNACEFKPEVIITDNWGKPTKVTFDGIIKVTPQQ